MGGQLANGGGAKDAGEPLLNGHVHITENPNVSTALSHLSFRWSTPIRWFVGKIVIGAGIRAALLNVIIVLYLERKHIFKYKIYKIQCT